MASRERGPLSSGIGAASRNFFPAAVLMYCSTSSCDEKRSSSLLCTSDCTRERRLQRRCSMTFRISQVKVKIEMLMPNRMKKPSMISRHMRMLAVSGGASSSVGIHSPRT